MGAGAITLRAVAPQKKAPPEVAGQEGRWMKTLSAFTERSWMKWKALYVKRFTFASEQA
jgi:hypothetical protein